MRKRHLEIFEDWGKFRANTKYDSVWTDGYSIYSYTTCILAYTDDDDFIFNATKYTHTTTEIQNNLLNYIHAELFPYPPSATVCNAPKGITAEELRGMVPPQSPLTDYIATFYNTAAT